MVTILIRTLLIYVFLLLTMRFMGKRQLGELEISELVTTLLLSEIASLPITTPELPLLHSIIPIAALMSLEVLLSASLLRFPKLKSLLSTRPAFLIYRGNLRHDAMRSVRMSYEELISQLRQKDITDISSVEYAILESNGKISTILKEGSQTVTRDDLNINNEENGMMHIIVSDGKISQRTLKMLGKNDAWLSKVLASHKMTVDQVYLMTSDDCGNLRICASDSAGRILKIDKCNKKEQKGEEK